jgi:hypothetical protein
LKDSLLSGKKVWTCSSSALSPLLLLQVIIEDGREVYQSKSSRFSFHHSWESTEGHVFRIETSEVEDLFTIDSIPFQNFEPKPIELKLPEPEAVDEVKESPKSEISGLSSPQLTEQSSTQRQDSLTLTFDPFGSSSESNTSPEIFPLSQSLPLSQNHNPPSSFDFFDSSQTPPKSSTFDLFDDRVPSSAPPAAANANAPQTHPPPSTFDLFDNSPSPVVKPTSHSPFSVFDSFSNLTPQVDPLPAGANASPFDLLGSEEFLPQQPARSDPRPVSPSHSFDPFADLSSPESVEVSFGIAQPTPAPAMPLNPFETDTYPVFTSSSPDPFFSLSIK